MSENKNKEINNKSTEGKSKLSERNLAIIITAALLAAIAVTTAIVFVVQAIKSDAGFKYLKSDLDKYIEFTEDYTDFTINLDIAKPKDIDVDVALLQLLAASKTGNGDQKNLDGWSWEIGAGDVVSIYYRGYIIGDNGEQIAVDGMSNFADTAPYSLTIGSGSFVPGFEYNMVGQLTSDSNRFNKITTGKPTENQVAYVSYTRTEADDSSKSSTASNVRIDLSDPDINDTYGVKFKETIMNTAIGTKVELLSSIDGKNYNYKDLVVNFVTECEDKHLVVECYFPYDYQKEDLRNETAYFEVYVEKFVDYTAPELNDEFLKKQFDDKKVKVSLETVNGYEGETLVEKYRAYANELLMKEYEREYDTLLREAIIEHFRSISKAIKYPGIMVDEVYQDYYDTINDSYITNEGKITNSYGSTSTYSTLDTYAAAYLGLATGQSWTKHIKELSENSVKERLILYYIIRAEELIPATDAEFQKEIEATKEKIVNDYIEQYLAYEGKTAADYEDYDAFVEERRADVLGYYDGEYFAESTYFELLMREAIKWPKVVTLDERRAYPVSK